MDAPELLTRPQAAEYLGVAVTTLEAWAIRGTVSLPFVKLGRRVKYRRRDLDRFLEERTVNPGAPKQ